MAEQNMAQTEDIETRILGLLAKMSEFSDSTALRPEETDVMKEAVSAITMLLSQGLYDYLASDEGDPACIAQYLESSVKSYHGGSQAREIVTGYIAHAMKIREAAQEYITNT